MENYIDELKDSLKGIDIFDKETHCFCCINVNNITGCYKASKKSIIEALKLFQICINICRDNNWLDYVEPNLTINLKDSERAKAFKPLVPKTLEDIVKDMESSIDLCLCNKDRYNFIFDEIYSYNYINTDFLNEYVKTENIGIIYNALKGVNCIKDGYWFYYRDITMFYNENISRWNVRRWKQ